MPFGVFETSCTYIRFVSLVMGFILFLAAFFVHIRPLSKHKLYEDDKTTRATKLYLRSQHDQKEHLFWMLVIFAIVIWYAGALISSSYVTNIVVQKGGECLAGSNLAAEYSDYNMSILYPPVLFMAGLLAGIGAHRSAGTTNKFLQGISYLLILAGTVSVILLFRNVEICAVSSQCM